jgi:hypothetical protein
MLTTRLGEFACDGLPPCLSAPPCSALQVSMVVLWPLHVVRLRSGYFRPAGCLLSYNQDVYTRPAVH